jgi:hypothetical protein
MSSDLALYMAYTGEEWSPRLTGREAIWDTQQDDENPFYDMMDREW